MRNFKLLLLLCSIFTSTFIIYSCTKDDPLGKMSNSSAQLESRTSGRIGDNLTETTTVLGRHRTNPYTVANMTSAYNALYKTNITALPVTHKYVKFMPSSAEHVGIIQSWELAQKIAVFDFPLDYEITTMGDGYYDPAAPDSLLTFRYASVPVGVTLPSCPSQLLSDLVIPPYNSFLTEMAFYQVQEEWKGNNSPHPVGPGTDGTGNPTNPGTGGPGPGTGPGTGGPGPGTNDNCTPVCSNYPCCNVGWNDCDEYPCGTTLTPNCQPGSPEWPFCLEINPPFGPGITEPRAIPEFCSCTQYFNNQPTSTWTVQLAEGQDCDDIETQWGIGAYTICNQLPPPPPPPAVNECGCTIPSNIRFPAGCIQVDRDGSNVPVQQVMVKVKDTWFTSDITFSTNAGCWKVEKAYSGKMWMFVQFENPNCEVRAVRKWYYHKALVVADDYVGDFWGPTFNNILVRYSSGAGDVESLARMYWACAHTINSDNEYRISAGGQGVPVPRSGLNYLLKSNTFIAGTPMLQAFPFSTSFQLLVAFDLPNIISGIAAINAGTPLSPDIMRGYDLEQALNYSRITKHELGHASHHGIVGESYWVPYRTHIVNNDLAGNGVYGSFGDFAPLSDPDRIALGESIGNFTENIYGRVTPVDGGNWIDNFIPAGLMFDLGDNSTTETITDPNNGTSRIDNISGFTPSMIFNALQPNVNSIRNFRDRLRINSLGATPNSATNFNAFVDVYDVFN
jgi:hypothetical protein